MKSKTTVNALHIPGLEHFRLRHGEALEAGITVQFMELQRRSLGPIWNTLDTRTYNDVTQRVKVELSLLDTWFSREIAELKN